MQPNYFNILEECIELGVPRGYYRAHKHVEKPNDQQIFIAIEEAIMAEICQRFIFQREQ